MRSARKIRSRGPVAFIALTVVSVLAMTGIALAATDPNIIPDPDVNPNDGAIQDYCDTNYPGTTGIVFSTGSATSNSQGELTKTEAGYTLTWVEATAATDDFDIRVVSITEAGDTVPLQFSVVIAFLGGNDTNGYEYDPPLTTDELNVEGATGQNITHFGFCAITTGEIIVEKITDPTPSTETFDFTASWDGDGFTLADGESIGSGRLDDGVYSVAEIVPAGWDLTSATCDDGSPINAIDLQIAETITCTFVNQQDANIIIEKQTDPDGSTQLFDFTTDYSAGFQLADGDTNDSGDLVPGTYSVSETLPDGWTLDSATCDDGSDPAAINLEAGETVTCTFNNRQDAFIVVEKETDPGGSTQAFTFTTDYSADFDLADGESNTSDPLAPDTYSVAETVPDGWELSSATCDDGSAPAAIDLTAGETVTCTFVNQADSSIVVIKETDPGGSPDAFTFTTDYSADFDLADGESNDSGDLDPGTYSVAETVPDGWDLISATCDDGSNPAAINLAAGETVTCTFVNQADANIIVEKQTDPDGSTQLFDFTTDYSAGFQLADGDTNDSGDLDPGTYSVSETVPDGWELDSVECSDGSDPEAINLAAGETVTCVFTNQADANIIVVKETDPDGSLVLFDFTADYSAGFQLADGDSNDSGDIGPGTYSVSETVPDGWELVAAICSDGSDPSAIDLVAGETVTCTFSNQQLSTIIVEKETDPGGSPVAFTFTTDYSADFALADGESDNSGYLSRGTYSVAETVPDGWDLISATCDDGSDPGAIDLDAGETVTCTFVNQADANIIVEKQTIPDGSTELFTFSTSYSADLDLSDGQTDDSGDLDPGTYSVTETVPAGWDLTDAICSDGSQPDAIDLAAGETVTCVFTNTQRGMVELLKLNNGVEETTVEWTFTLTGPEVDTSDTTPPALLDFGGAKLIPGETYTVCETGLPAGWDTVWTVGGVAVTPYDPNAGVPDASNDTWCVDITVEPGQTLGIVVDNIPPPGGGQRTPGYWKNWNSCSPGNQAATAERNGGVDAGFHLLEDVLPMTVGDLAVEDCETGRLLLDRRDLDEKGGKHRKRASDAAYNLASHLIAAQANVAAGASTCDEVNDAIVAANELLSSIGFDGTGAYLRPKDGDLYHQALELAALLDAYNNGEVC